MDENTNVPTALSGNIKFHSSMDYDFCRPRISIKTSNALLSEENISTTHRDRFSSESESASSLLEKGVLIHIVEDPNLLEHQHEQSAVLISVPPETNINAHNSNPHECQEDVFSTAQVTVSVQYLASMPVDRSTFFGNLCSVMDIKVDDNTEYVTLQGAWSQILMAQAAMKAYLMSWKQQEMARLAYESLRVSDEFSQGVSDKQAAETAIAACEQQAAAQYVTVVRGSPMRTRHQERLQAQKEKVQVRGRRKSVRVEVEKEEEEESVVTASPPRENKENEVHLSISLAESAPCQQVGGSNQEDLAASEELFIIPSSSTDQCYGNKKRKGPKKNYEQLAPFKFFCTICSFKTKRESHYQSHLERHETISNLYSCDTCTFTTIRLGHLRRHELTHSTTMLSCSLCSYHTDDARHLSRHERLKHVEQEESVVEKPLEVLSCGKCAYSTTKMHLFQRHLKVHSTGARQQDIRNFQCEQCSYKTSRKEHYLRHVNNVHQNRRPYLCDFCGKAFKRPDALKQHGITHAELDPTVAVFRCSFCNKGCRSQTHLNEHLAVHSNIRSFLCEICGLSFKTRSVQRKHVLTIHKNPHAFSCHRCLKRFNTKYALRRHMKQHSWKDDAPEEECGNTTTTNTHTVVIQTSEGGSEGPSHNNTLTVQVPEEILASLPPGAVAVPLFSVMPHTTEKVVNKVSEGVAAAEVLALQLKQMPSCDEGQQEVVAADPARPATMQVSQHFLTTSADDSTSTLYVTRLATNFEQF